jgi:hypothetical protein
VDAGSRPADCSSTATAAPRIKKITGNGFIRREEALPSVDYQHQPASNAGLGKHGASVGGFGGCQAEVDIGWCVRAEAGVSMLVVVALGELVHESPRPLRRWVDADRVQDLPHGGRGNRDAE